VRVAAEAPHFEIEVTRIEHRRASAMAAPGRDSPLDRQPRRQ
jgi:hypothetical protein